MARWWGRWIFGGIGVLVAPACAAGGRGALTFERLEHPVSMSSYIEEPSGRILSPDDLDEVAVFHHDMRFWGMAYSALRLTGEKDLSEPINEQVRAARGDGVILLTVISEGCAWNRVPLLTLLPIWPGCTKVSIQGTIVRSRPQVAATPTAPNVLPEEPPAEAEAEGPDPAHAEDPKEDVQLPEETLDSEAVPRDVGDPREAPNSQGEDPDAINPGDTPDSTEQR